MLRRGINLSHELTKCGQEHTSAYFNLVCLIQGQIIIVWPLFLNWRVDPYKDSPLFWFKTFDKAGEVIPLAGVVLQCPEVFENLVPPLFRDLLTAFWSTSACRAHFSGMNQTSFSRYTSFSALPRLFCFIVFPLVWFTESLPSSYWNGVSSRAALRVSRSSWGTEVPNLQLVFV